MKTTMLVLGLCALVQAAGAQTIYKCTTNGKVSYGEQPCAAGKTTQLAVSPAPSGEQAAAALERDKARLAALQKERAAVLSGAPIPSMRQKCDRLRLQVKWADEDAARAGKEAATAARLKARRQAEALAVQCPA
jgi:hypothetical protein